MKIYPAAVLILLSLLLSGCYNEPDSVPKSDLVSFRIVVKGIEYDSGKFTLDYVYNNLNGSAWEEDTWYCSDYNGKYDFNITEWIISTDPAVSLEPSGEDFIFYLIEGEPVPEKIILNTTKPIYMREKITWCDFPPLTMEQEKDITVAKVYFETAEVPVTIKN